MDTNSPMCRVCTQIAMELVDLGSEINDGLLFTVLESYNFCTQLNATQDDDLPQHLCTSCNDELRNAFEFIRKAQEADRMLRSKIEETRDDTKYLFIRTSDDHSGEDAAEHKSEEDEFIKILYDVDVEDLGKSTFDRSPFQIERIVEDVTATQEYDEVPKEQRANKAKFSCSQCTKLFNSQRQLETHLRRSHIDNKLLCNVCGKICASTSSLTTHLFQHRGKKPFSCQKCNKKYFTKHGLHLHMSSTHSDAKVSKFLCSICGKNFATKQRLEIHYLTHTGERKYDCSLCEKKFATPFRLRNHLRIHTGERPYQCKICGIKFAQTNALKCHERIHTGEKPYECKICGKRFNQNTILKTHMTLHTGKTVQCPLCDKKFSRPSCLILHQREHTGEKPYACYKCPNKYKQKSHLDRHLDTHFGIKHRCNICKKEYSKRSSLTIHMFEHTDEKPFQCPDCMTKFTRKDKYKTHLMKAHNKILVKHEISEVVKLDNDTEAMISNNQEILVEVNGTNDRNKSDDEIVTFLD